MGKAKKQSFLQGALILSGAAILVKIIGALFKIPLQQFGGMVAFGYFSTAYEIYTPIYVIAIAGLPVAVSRMVSERVALGRYRDVRVIYRVAHRAFLLTGTVGMLAMIIAAFLYPQFVGNPDNLYAMLIMAPAVFCCCMVSAHRGLYEGLRNMTPTAISQVIEALGKLLLGLGLAFIVKKLGWGDPFVAAAAMVGVTLGTVFSLLYMMVRYRRHGTGITRAELACSPPPVSGRSALKLLLAIAIPVALGSVATQITNLVDVTSLQRCLRNIMESDGEVVRELYASQLSASGVEAGEVATWLYGNRGTAMTYVNLVPNLTLTFGISALPVITTAWATKDQRQLRGTVESVLRITLLIALPAGIGMAVLGEPLMYLIYGSTAVSSVVGPLLNVLGIAVIFICLIAPINAMLQAVGRADLPVKIMVVGGILKFVLNIVLVSRPEINIMGSAISTLVCYIVMVVMSVYMLCRVIRIRMRFRTVVLKPLLAALLCGGAAWGVNRLVGSFTGLRLAAIVAVLAAIAVYVFFLLKLKTLTKSDVLMLPKGQKIAQLLEKYNWIG